MPERCRCRVADWAALRLALNAEMRREWNVSLTQQVFARLLFCSSREIQVLEAPGPHRCPSPAIVGHLRYLLRTEIGRTALAAAGFPHPYPEDL